MNKTRIGLLGAGLLYSHAAFGSCAIVRPFCEALPDRANANSAIFLGVVRELLPPPAFVPPAAGVAGQSRRRAGDPTSPPLMRYPVARLRVLEPFSGAQFGDFEVRLTSDHFLDDEPQQVPAMQEGDVWLVDAYRDPRDRLWYTSFCQRSKPAAEATEDLHVLRTWAAGQTLPTEFSGEVFDPTQSKNVPAVRVYLRGENRSFSAVTDDQGRFLIPNLPPGVYQARIDLPDAGAAVQIDLTHAWCAHRTFIANSRNGRL